MIVVESGAALINSNSYNSVSDIDAYAALRGKPPAEWLDLDIDVKEAAMIRACDYMIWRYRQRWRGQRYTSRQALDWPRQFVEKFQFGGIGMGFFDYYAIDAIPLEIKNAHAELTFRAVAGELMPDLSADDFASYIRVGPIAVTYQQNVPGTTIYPMIEAMLAPFLVGNSGISSARLVRT